MLFEGLSSAVTKIFSGLCLIKEQETQYRLFDVYKTLLRYGTQASGCLQ